MPLIQSKRWLPGDLDAWHAEERAAWYDNRSGRLEESALRAIEPWLRQANNPSVACSWGKDSLVVAHLTRRVSPAVPIVWVRLPTWDNPDCPEVRDAYLAEWPTPYEEVWADAPDVSCGHLPTGARRSGYARARRSRVTGIRADESGARALSAKVHGISTHRVCRPILKWSANDVFGYLRRYDIPIHPAYAMTLGGQIQRARLRVASIGGVRGRAVGRLSWERAYYSDVLANFA